MAKKVLSVLMAVLITASLSVTSFAQGITVYRTYISVYSSTIKEFTAETKYKELVNIVTAGIQCLRIDTGAQVGKGYLASDGSANAPKSVYYVAAFEGFDRSSYSMKIRALGSHSAYKDGQAVLFEFTQSAAI